MNLERWPKFDSGDDNEPIVAVRWKTAKTCSEVETPSLAVIWRASCMTLTRGVNDESELHMGIVGITIRVIFNEHDLS